MAKINPKRLKELYDEGLTDREIGAELSCSSSRIRYWRRKMGFPSKHIWWSTNKIIDDKALIKLKQLYEAGLTDPQIAEKLNCSVMPVWYCRKKKLGLPSNWEVKIDLVKLKKLYDRGCSDHEMAREFDCDDIVIRRRRKKLGLKPLYGHAGMSLFDLVDHKKFKEAYNRGCSDHEIARELDLTFNTTITLYRQRLGLPVNEKA